MVPLPSNIPSLIKWTGSKRSQAHAIVAQMPSYNRYFEPFLGGGAVLYLAKRPAVAGDVYAPLVGFWNLVKDCPEVVVRDYTEQWQALQADLPEYFYKVRERFNREQLPLDLSFLMRTCVNGIVRFNSEGQFNNSFHLSRPGMDPNRFARIVYAWNEAIQQVDFFCQDYEETIAAAGAGDFVYFDPPYAGNHQRYTNDLDLDRFFHALEALNHRGVRWALSFDGRRGATDLTHPVPRDLFRRRVLIPSGYSAVGKVLNGSIETVQESLYLNY